VINGSLNVAPILYAISMLFGACIVRVPAEGWQPEDWEQPIMTKVSINPETPTRHVTNV
jgi:hypothetical protein